MDLISIPFSFANFLASGDIKILSADSLDTIADLTSSLTSIFLGGFPLGFWFAQQGSIYIFVILIFIYVYLMNKLDKEHNLEE